MTNPDAICVSHIAWDHVGDTATIAAEYSLPVITEPATKFFLEYHGIPEDQIHLGIWGMEAFVGELSIRILEAHHESFTELEGHLLTGHPLSFLVSNGETAVHHLGDTSLFRDLRTYGELYEPDAAMIGVGQAYDAAARVDGPVTRNIAELTTEEAVLATKWLGVDAAVPMHCLPDEERAFVDEMGANSDAPEAVALEPGESLTVP
jgi:L-ascorbate metabolism protein UlaG (beta-lactamase superfamily)